MWETRNSLQIGKTFTFSEFLLRSPHLNPIHFKFRNLSVQLSNSSLLFQTFGNRFILNTTNRKMWAFNLLTSSILTSLEVTRYFKSKPTLLMFTMGGFNKSSRISTSCLKYSHYVSTSNHNSEVVFSKSVTTALSSLLNVLRNFLNTFHFNRDRLIVVTPTTNVYIRWQRLSTLKIQMWYVLSHSILFAFDLKHLAFKIILQIHGCQYFNIWQIVIPSQTYLI